MVFRVFVVFVVFVFSVTHLQLDRANHLEELIFGNTAAGRDDLLRFGRGLFDRSVLVQHGRVVRAGLRVALAVVDQAHPLLPVAAVLIEQGLHELAVLDHVLVFRVCLHRRVGRVEVTASLCVVHVFECREVHSGRRCRVVLGQRGQVVEALARRHLGTQ